MLAGFTQLMIIIYWRINIIDFIKEIVIGFDFEQVNDSWDVILDNIIINPLPHPSTFSGKTLIFQRK